MCLNCADKIKIAQEDIKCYKCLGPFKKSPCYGFAYEEGKTYSLGKPLHRLKVKSDWDIIEEGFHAYLEFPTGNCSWVNVSGYTILNISLTSIPSCYIAECIIPKGAKYCVGDSFDVVTNKLKVNCIRCINEATETSLEIFKILRTTRLTEEVKNLLGWIEDSLEIQNTLNKYEDCILIRLIYRESFKEVLNSFLIKTIRCSYEISDANLLNELKKIAK